MTELTNGTEFIVARSKKSLARSEVKYEQYESKYDLVDKGGHRIGTRSSWRGSLGSAEKVGS
jgi:hypothetical protein